MDGEQLLVVLNNRRRGEGEQLQVLLVRAIANLAKGKDSLTYKRNFILLHIHFLSSGAKGPENATPV